MNQFTLKLRAGYANPVIVLSDFHNLLALIDTGAGIPVITLPEDKVLSMGGKLKQKDINVRGLSHSSNKGSLYQFKNFKLGDVMYVELDVAVVPDDKSPYNMLLSSTMFRDMIYEIDDLNHRFNVSVRDSDCIRKLVAYYDKDSDKLYVHYNE